MEVEKKGGASFPSNYVTIHQLRQRWLQQQHSSSSCSSSVVISESNHRDDDDDDDVESSKKPQNDAVSAHSPPPAITKSPSYNNKNKASSSSNPNPQPPLSPISSSSSSSGASKKKPQNDAVSPPPAKTKTKTKSPPPPQQNHHNEIVSKTLNETRFRKACNPNRLLPPQKPKPKPTDSANHQPISINQISKKNPIPHQTLTAAASLPEADPKPELEVVVVVVVEEKEGGHRKSNKKKKKKKAVRESKMAPELEQVVEKKKQLRESRDWDKKGVREFKDKAASFDQNRHDAVGDNVVEPELEVEMEMEVEAVVVEEPRETRGRRDWDSKTVREFKPKTPSFGRYDYSSNVDNNDDVGGGGVKAVEVDKVVGDGDVDVVKQNSRRGSGRFDHQGQGKQSLKAASFDHDQDMSETAVKESDAVNYNTNATSDGRSSNWKRGSGRFSGQGIRRPLYSKPLIATTKGKVWVKKGESTTPN